MVLKRIGVGLAALGLLGYVAPSATADTYKTITFVGSAVLLECPGLAYPIGAIPGTTTKTDPKGLPQVNLSPGGTTCRIIFSALCIKTSAGKKTIISESCSITATGIVTGYCGLSTGVGAAHITSLTKETITTPFKFTEAGIAEITGGTMQTNILGFVSMTPTTGTCATGTATGFTWVGEIAYKDCTDTGTVATACDP